MSVANGRSFKKEKEKNKVEETDSLNSSTFLKTLRNGEGDFPDDLFLLDFVINLVLTAIENLPTHVLSIVMFFTIAHYLPKWLPQSISYHYWQGVNNLSVQPIFFLEQENFHFNEIYSSTNKSLVKLISINLKTLI